NNFLLSGFEFEENDDFLKFKFKIVNSIALIVTIFSLIFAILSNLGINELGVIHTNVNYAYALIALLSTAYLRLSKENLMVSTHIILVASLLTFASALVFVIQDEFRIIWFYLLVYAAYILAGSMYGIAYTIVSIVVILLENYFFDLGLSELAINSAILGLVIGSFLSFIYTNKITQYHEILYNKNKELEKLSSTDFLTGIMNKRIFEQTIHNIFVKSNKKREIFALIILELDYFKEINTQYGHVVGDEILVSFTYVVKLILKKEDVFARISGAEFVVVLEDTSKKDAIRVAQKICQELARREIYVTGNSIQVNTSIGVSMSEPEDTHFTEIFKRSDRALDKAKEEGRNKVCIL
ncbi:GGDEF domain-containing protein, partial [Sulfurimonas sp. SAG-AH-194-L11]